MKITFLVVELGLLDAGVAVLAVIALLAVLRHKSHTRPEGHAGTPAVAPRPIPAGSTTPYPAQSDCIGSLIRELRKERGLSQSALARLICEPFQRIGDWERSERTPTWDQAVELGKAFQREPDAFYRSRKREPDAAAEPTVGAGTFSRPWPPNRIREWRGKRKLTLEELGDLVGLDGSYIGKMERGDSSPPIRCLIEIARALNCCPADLLPTFRPET